MNFTCHGCARLFSAEDKLQLHEKSFTGTITSALQRFSTCLSDSPHELLRALLPNLHQLLQALESDFNGPLGLSLLRTSLYELLQALEHTPIPCPGCEKSFESERNLRRHYRRHVYIHEECRYCSKPLKNVSQVHTHPANCPDRNGAKLTNEEFDTRQWLINHSNNRLDEERQLVRQSLKRTREEKEEGGGGDNKRGVSKAKRGGSDNTCGESGGSGCEGSLPTLPHSDNLRPEQMPSGDNTAWQNAVSQEIQCSSTDKNVAAAQQEAFSYRQNPLLDNGPTGGPTVITPRREATSSHNIDKISHPCPWNDTEVTAQVPSTTYGTYTEEREQQSNNWAPGVVQVPTPTNYSLVEDDNIYMQAPSLFSHPFDQFIIADMLGTQHNDEITTANSLPLDEFLGYGTQHHPP